MDFSSRCHCIKFLFPRLNEPISHCKGKTRVQDRRAVQGQALRVQQTIFLFSACSRTKIFRRLHIFIFSSTAEKRVFFSATLLFLPLYLYKAVEINSTRKQLYTQVTTKKSRHYETVIFIRCVRRDAEPV
jgi:hypothetical protein